MIETVNLQYLSGEVFKEMLIVPEPRICDEKEDSICFGFCTSSVRGQIKLNLGRRESDLVISIFFFCPPPCLLIMRNEDSVAKPSWVLTMRMPDWLQHPNM